MAFEKLKDPTLLKILFDHINPFQLVDVPFRGEKWSHLMFAVSNANYELVTKLYELGVDPGQKVESKKDLYLLQMEIKDPTVREKIKGATFHAQTKNLFTLAEPDEVQNVHAQQKSSDSFHPGSPGVVPLAASAMPIQVASAMPIQVASAMPIQVASAIGVAGGGIPPLPTSGTPAPPQPASTNPIKTAVDVPAAASGPPTNAVGGAEDSQKDKSPPKKSAHKKILEGDLDDTGDFLSDIDEQLLRDWLQQNKPQPGIKHSRKKEYTVEVEDPANPNGLKKEITFKIPYSLIIDAGGNPYVLYKGKELALGKGTFGVVKLGRRIELDPEKAKIDRAEGKVPLVAVKVAEIDPNNKNDERYFKREARFIKKKERAGDRSLFIDKGPSKKSKGYIVMNLASGSTLHSQFDNIKETKEKLEVAQTCLESLQYFHNHNLIHRDLHANNFLYDANKHPKIDIIDLGLMIDINRAKEIAQKKPSNVFKNYRIEQGVEFYAGSRYAGGYYRKTGHFAPESQLPVQGKNWFSKNSDIYAIGHMLENLGSFDKSIDSYIQDLKNAMLNPSPFRRPAVAACIEEIKLITEIYHAKQNKQPTAKQEAKLIKIQFERQQEHPYVQEMIDDFKKEDTKKIRLEKLKTIPDHEFNDPSLITLALNKPGPSTEAVINYLLVRKVPLKDITLNEWEAISQYPSLLKEFSEQLIHTFKDKTAAEQENILTQIMELRLENLALGIMKSKEFVFSDKRLMDLLKTPDIALTVLSDKEVSEKIFKKDSPSYTLISKMGHTFTDPNFVELFKRNKVEASLPKEELSLLSIRTILNINPSYINNESLRILDDINREPLLTVARSLKVRSIINHPDFYFQSSDPNNSKVMTNLLKKIVTTFNDPEIEFDATQLMDNVAKKGLNISAIDGNILSDPNFLTNANKDKFTQWLIQQPGFKLPTKLDELEKIRNSLLLYKDPDVQKELQRKLNFEIAKTVAAQKEALTKPKETKNTADQPTRHVKHLISAFENMKNSATKLSKDKAEPSKPLKPPRSQ